MLTGQKWFRLNCIHAENEVYWVKIMTLSHQDSITSSILYFKSGMLKTTSWFMKCEGENKIFMWNRLLLSKQKMSSFCQSSPFLEILFIFHNFAPAHIETKSGPAGKMRTNLWQGANTFIILSFSLARPLRMRNSMSHVIQHMGHIFYMSLITNIMFS